MHNSKIHGPPSAKTWRPFSFYVYLLNCNAETTPTSSEEFELAQAGLGKRHLTMSRDMSHEEFFGLLQNEYPKMQGLTGGWLLYKATGGQGKRRLTLVPPDSDGYTGTLICSVTGAGKNLMYIVPLQQEFDLTPLPPDAVEFKNMPKAQCQICKVSLPLQILALHVQECTEAEFSDNDTEACQSKVQIVSVITPEHTDTEESDEEKLPCPICNLKFASHFLEIHASTCGERSKDDPAMDEAEGNKGEEEHMKSINDVLDTICQRVDGQKQFSIHITRTNLLERGLLQWQRQKKNSPTALLKVSFFGEARVDTGALRKEFLTEMVTRIESRFFEGPPHHKSPRYSLTDFDNGLFSTTVGEILAVSLAQGGPAPVFFSSWAHSYLCNGQINKTLLNKDVVADSQLCSLIDQVNAEFVMEAIHPQLSEKGTTKHQIELEMINFIQDLLYESEESPEHLDDEGPRSITPARFLQWITGQAHVPLLPSEKKDFSVVIKFNHVDFGNHGICYPVVSACAKTITLPVKHMQSYDQFKMVLMEAFQLGQEFNNV